ncbi:MAG: small-conductance mechanosensitive channel [Rhodothermales bacterium]|jgi:small-conductance mechanosensitive channel
MDTLLDQTRAIWDFTLFTVPGGSAYSVGQLLLVAALVLGGYLGSRIIERVFGRRLAGSTIRPDAVHTLKRVVFYALLIGVFMTALALLRVPLTAFAFVSGAIAIGVGFGAQNIINNFISGWILMVERPIRLGDFVELDTGQGVVENIGNRSTRIRRFDGVHLLVPNSQLLERTVVNWTLLDEQIRTTVTVGVAYGSPVQLVMDLLQQATQEQPEVNIEPKPLVVFEDFGDNSLVFDSLFWCDVSGERALREIRSSIRIRVSQLFDEHQIVIAFPQRDVHIDSLRPIEVRLTGATAKR